MFAHTTQFYREVDSSKNHHVGHNEFYTILPLCDFVCVFSSLSLKPAM